jgi:hypothetical protein
MDSEDDFENSDDAKDIDNCFFVLSLFFLEIFYGLDE